MRHAAQAAARDLHRPTLSHTHYAYTACCPPTHTHTPHVHTHDMYMPHAHPRAAHTQRLYASPATASLTTRIVAGASHFGNRAHFGKKAVVAMAYGYAKIICLP
jgi:hypothetical protein